MRTNPACMMAALALLAGACVDGDDAVSVSLANLGRGAAGHVGATISITGADGAPVAASPGNTAVTVETRGAGGAWQPASAVTADFSAAPRLDVMLVVDNSGSTREALDEMQAALRQTAASLLQGQRHRVGLVRVSTNAQVVQPPTRSAAAIEDAIGRLFVANGWTALWDGVRQANEAIEAHQVVLDGGAACFTGAAPTLVVLTDGKDNNSADEQPSRYPGDGVDTTLDDLLVLAAGGIATAIHTIGVTAEADEASLRLLADATGGRYLRIPNYGQLVSALQSTTSHLDGQIPVCFQPASCGHDEARIVVRTKHGRAWTERTFVVALPATCP